MAGFIAAIAAAGQADAGPAAVRGEDELQLDTLRFVAEIGICNVTTFVYTYKKRQSIADHIYVVHVAWCSTRMRMRAWQCGQIMPFPELLSIRTVLVWFNTVIGGAWFTTVTGGLYIGAT